MCHLKINWLTFKDDDHTHSELVYSTLGRFSNHLVLKFLSRSRSSCCLCFIGCTFWLQPAAFQLLDYHYLIFCSRELWWGLIDLLSELQPKLRIINTFAKLNANNLKTYNLGSILEVLTSLARLNFQKSALEIARLDRRFQQCRMHALSFAYVHRPSSNPVHRTLGATLANASFVATPSLEVSILESETRFNLGCQMHTHMIQ